MGRIMKVLAVVRHKEEDIMHAQSSIKGKGGDGVWLSLSGRSQGFQTDAIKIAIL